LFYDNKLIPLDKETKQVFPPPLPQFYFLSQDFFFLQQDFVFLQQEHFSYCMKKKWAKKKNKKNCFVFSSRGIFLASEKNSE